LTENSSNATDRSIISTLTDCIKELIMKLTPLRNLTQTTNCAKQECQYATETTQNSLFDELLIILRLQHYCKKCSNSSIKQQQMSVLV